MQPEEENVLPVRLAGTHLCPPNTPAWIREFQVWGSVCLGEHQTFLLELRELNANIPGFFNGNTLLHAAGQLDSVVDTFASPDLQHVMYAMATVRALANNGPPDLEWAGSWDAFAQSDKDAVRTYMQSLSIALRMHVDQ